MTVCLPAASSPRSLPAVKAGLGLLARRFAAGAAGSASGLEIVFVPSPALHDGRFANDGWLQELPDPITKLTWDNPALVSPKTAETLGLANEDVVRVDYSGRSLEIPVWLVPGMADGVVALTLGYGRSHAGRIGSGVGFDAFKVRSSKAPGFDSGVTLTKVARLTRSRRPRSTAAWRGAPSCASRRWPRFDRSRLPPSDRRRRSRRQAAQVRAGESLAGRREGGRSLRRARRLRREPASLLPLEGACLRSGPSVGDDD